MIRKIIIEVIAIEMLKNSNIKQTLSGFKN